MVVRRVFRGVFHRLRHDLRADHPLRVPREAERDGARAAVEIERELSAVRCRVFHRARVKPLRLRRIDLEKGLRSDAEGEPQQLVAHRRLAPERVKLARQDGVAPRLVDVQYDPRELRAALAQMGNERIGPCTEAPRRDDAADRVPGFSGLAAEHVPHDALSACLVIGRDALARHELRHGGGAAAAERGLDEAALHRQQLVAAFAVEAEAGRSAPIANGKNSLVAVILRLLASEDLPHALLLFADMPQRGVHALALEAQLFSVVHVQAVAAAAFAEERTGGLDAGRGGGGQQPFAPGEDGCVRDLHDPERPFLARQCARHEDRAPIQVHDAQRLGGHTVDKACEDLIFRKMIRHTVVLSGPICAREAFRFGISARLRGESSLFY